MRKTRMGLILAISIILAFNSFAEDYGGIDFPNGDISFADGIVSFKNAEGVEGSYANPSSALGPPDYDSEEDTGYVSLGNGKNVCEGELILEFIDNALVDIPGDDLWIFEIGPAVEAVDVYVCDDGKNWISLGVIEGSTRGIDIAEYTSPGQKFQFVKLCDHPDGRTSGSPWGGPDIDAVGAIGTITITSATSLTEVWNCGPCSSYDLQFDGPLEYTPYLEPLNVGAQNPGNIYVVYSVIDRESRPWWTQATGVWQAWGPYEFKSGNGYILKFGPRDIISMTEGPLPYYAEGTAAWLQVENVDYWDENSYSFCIVPQKTFFTASTTHTPTQTDAGGETLILDIDTLRAVYNRPAGSVYLDLTDKTRITKIQTYHWNYGAGTESPGSILIVDMNPQESDGGYPMTEYEAYGLQGSGGAPNAYWVVEPDIVLEPGQYMIIDSETSTWAQNDETGGVGVTKVWGIVES